MKFLGVSRLDDMGSSLVTATKEVLVEGAPARDIQEERLEGTPHY